ncbi:hypothetical protein BSL78_18803 [Apostichopus japonicus]|uniref:Retrovirus-related Pol polyprotein from transposon 412 n=1 Tax=Stichopus japonicus TaxID=307972 RepID=A0A2G8K8M5_STIJA|nr:hypothetical protein BSL78_18803 [Apostichopus japonicus]
MAKPLHALTAGTHPPGKRKDPSWNWTPECQAAFETLVKELSSPPILAFADFSKPFILHIDASGLGLGAALYQTQDGKERVVAYASRGLRKGEMHYPAHKLEFLSLKWAVTEKFKEYLYGRKFTVLTDNNPLTYVNTTAKLDATGHRWLAALSTYNYDLHYRPGKRNGDADGLSRRPHPDDPHTLTGDTVRAICEVHLLSKCTVGENPLPMVETLCSQTRVLEMECNGRTDTDLNQPQSLMSGDPHLWQNRQKRDPDIYRVIRYLERGLPPNRRLYVAETPSVKQLLRHWDKFLLKDGVLYRCYNDPQGENVYQLVLPPLYRGKAMAGLHDEVGHMGQERTLELLRERYFWPKMAGDYAEQLREKLEFAHQLAAKHSKERAQHNKHVYDSKAKGNELEPEDRVLVRNVHLRGKHKLADRWGQEVYKVLRRVNPDIPVYVVEQELGRGKRRTLHRNLLLPIPESMSTCDPPETPKKPVPRPRQCYHDKPLVDVTEDSDTDDQSSWYAVVTRPVPARRSRACLTPEEVPRILKEQEVTTLHGTLEEAEHNVSLEERRIPVEPEAVTPPTETPPIPAPRSPKTKTKSTPTGPVLGSRVRHAVHQLDDRQDWQHDAKVCHMLT